jgi:hypothetical protein
MYSGQCQDCLDCVYSGQQEASQTTRAGYGSGSSSSSGGVCSKKSSMEYHDEGHTSFDWRTAEGGSKLPPITDQSSECPGVAGGSCWLHAGIAAASSRFAIQCEVRATEFSMDHVVACGPYLGLSRWNGRCEGYDSSVVFKAAEKIGLTSEAAYNRNQGRCYYGSYKTDGDQNRAMPEMLIPYYIKTMGPVLVTIGEEDALEFAMDGRSPDSPFCLRQSGVKPEHGTHHSFFVCVCVCVCVFVGVCVCVCVCVCADLLLLLHSPLQPLLQLAMVLGEVVTIGSFVTATALHGAILAMDTSRKVTEETHKTKSHILYSIWCRA